MAMGGGEALRGACGLGPCTSPLWAPWQVCVAGLRTGGRTGSHRTTPPPLSPETTQLLLGPGVPGVCGHRPPIPASPPEGLVPAC